eukprot:scaffold22975_cov90-Phaeocystis_antarctica.AAC.1
MSKHGSLICQDSHPFAHLGRVRRYWRTYRDALTVGKPAACLRLVLNRRSFFAGEQRASNRDGKSRRAARHTRFLITCPLSSTLDLGRSSKPEICLSRSSEISSPVASALLLSKSHAIFAARTVWPTSLVMCKETLEGNEGGGKSSPGIHCWTSTNRLELSDTPGANLQ